MYTNQCTLKENRTMTFEWNARKANNEEIERYYCDYDIR